MNSDQKNIFNIPTNYHFLGSLLVWLERQFQDHLSEVKIILPNHRSCHEFKRLIAERKLGILPKITAISDISYDDFFEFLSNKEQEKEIKKTIDELLEIKVIAGLDQYIFLAQEISKLSVFNLEKSSTQFSQLFKIAIRLQRLFDDIEQEEINPDILAEIDDSNLSSHNQITLEFLKNFHTQIKNSLLRNNQVFASSFQNFVTTKFIEALEKFGSKTPVVIAGSTGSIPLSRRLIKVVSDLDNGYVVLHGFDKNLAEKTAEIHPQFFLNQLVNFLEINKKSIQEISETKLQISPQIRRDLLSQAMLPSKETIKWHDLESFLEVKKLSEDLTQNLQLIEARDEVEESEIIVKILVQSFREKKNLALIVNSSQIASLVKSRLNSLGLPFNDTRDQGIFSSKLIEFLLLILELWESDFNSHTLLALLKHPLCFYSLNHELIKDFEIGVLRQERVSQGIAGIQSRLQVLQNKKLTKFFDEFCGCFTAFSKQRFYQPLSLQTLDLIECAENFSRNKWQELLAKESAQNEIFEFFEKLKSQNAVIISPDDALATFRILFSQISFFEKAQAYSKIQILSNIEARLLNHDLVIVSGLNEGDFPAVEAANWLGKKIEKDLGIDRNLKKIGQSAYDFCNYFSNSSVVLTRSRTNNGGPAIESPFLLKLKTLCKKAKIELNSGEEFLAETKNLMNYELAPKKAPNPIPKKELRPQKFSITEISKLLSDPYAIYAKKILQLRELEKIDFEKSYAEFGSFVHKALEEFIKNPNQQNFIKKSAEIFTQFFSSKEAKLVWFPKFEKIFFDFVKENERFLNSENYAEIPVKLGVGDVLIGGKIDRLIISEDGSVEIFDYKTGQVPTKKSVKLGIEPQLTIAALALIEGVIDAKMKNVSEEKIVALNYWKLSSSSQSEITQICKKNEDIKILLSAAKSGLERLFEFFNDEKNGYIATKNNPNSEYQHLARNF